LGIKAWGLGPGARSQEHGKKGRHGDWRRESGENKEIRKY